MISGKFKSDKKFKTAFTHTETGYQLSLIDRKTGEKTEIMWGINDIIRHESRLPFIRFKNRIPQLDFSDHAYWFRLEIKNKSSSAVNYYLEQDKYLTSWFDLFFLHNGIWKMQTGAFEKPLAARPVKDSKIIHLLTLDPGNNTFYFRIEGIYKDTVPLRMWREDELKKLTVRNYFLHGCVFGLFLALLLTGLYLNFSLKQRSYFYLSFLIGSALVVHSSMSGFGFIMFWPESPGISVLLLFSFYPLTIFFNLLFCKTYLNTKRILPRLNHVFNGIIILAGILSLFQIISSSLLRYSLFAASIFLDYLTVIPLVTAAILALKKKNASARFLIIGIVFQILSYIEYWLSTYNAFPFTIINYLQIRPLGFAFVMMLGMSFKLRTMNADLESVRIELDELIRNQKSIKSIKNITGITETKVEAVRKYIHKHYRETLMREDLAHSVNMSIDHLGRMFKSLTGKKISEYINTLRIEEACRLLKEREDKIIDIAFEVGFESLRTFNKWFAKRHGKSPSEYKKQEIQ